MPAIHILIAGMARSYGSRNLGGQREFGTLPGRLYVSIRPRRICQLEITNWDFKFEATNCDLKHSVWE
jgi:hypothetical protein